MVYGREIDGQELSFEASGALLSASLVMRDKETDSWWSIMSSDAIGGELEGTDLTELPVSEKVRWKDWVARHPGTLVLSVDGIEHVANNPYDNYFTSEETFRGLEIDDDRLAPKAPIYAFWYEGKPYAVPHTSIEGGAVADLPGSDRQVALYREVGASIFSSTKAFLAPARSESVLDEVRTGKTGPLEPVGGFDTYWYAWISVNPGSAVIEPSSRSHP